MMRIGVLKKAMKYVGSALILFILVVVLLITYGNKPASKFSVKSDGDDLGPMVMDSATALKIAETIWMSHFGKGDIEIRNVNSVKLFHDSIWIVQKKYNTKKGEVSLAENDLYMEIQKKDCKVVKYQGIF